MQQSRFLVLTGHLNDYPLSDLVGILRHQHKTGRLLIEYPTGPASFFFKDGELIDAQLDKLTGLQALCVAQAQPPSSFNFNPLIKPTRRSIERSSQHAVSELLGCWSENDIVFEELAPAPPPPAALPGISATSKVDNIVLRPEESLIASPFRRPAQATNYSHLILGMAAAGLLLLGLSTVIAVTGVLGIQTSPAAISPQLPKSKETMMIQPASGELTPSEPELEERTASTTRRQLVKGKETAKVAPYSATREKLDSPSAEAVSSSADQGPLASGHRSDEGEKQSTQRAAPETQTVKVVLQIESGRVTKASIANHRPGMEAYEAMALRIARQRRYPSAGTTQETVTIKVTQPN